SGRKMRPMRRCAAPASAATAEGRSVGRSDVSDGEVFPVPDDWAKTAHMDAAAYDAAVLREDADAAGYWGDIGRRLDWMTPFSEVKDVSFHKHDFRIRWFADGVLNVSANCLDRHLKSNGDTIALIWENDDG